MKKFLKYVFTLIKVGKNIKIGLTPLFPPPYVKFSNENMSSKYKQFDEFEWNLKNTFTYDDRKGFSDLKIFTIQNNYRFSKMNEKYGLPFQFGFCADFSMDNKLNRLIQRYLCPEKMFLESPSLLFG